MPIDGVVVRNIARDLNNVLSNGRIDKVSQPEIDEIILSIRNGGTNYHLLLSSSPIYPRVHLTNLTKRNPINAPMFCMVLRKHLSGGRILKIEQHNLDRIIKIYVECYDELGNLSVKILFSEIMGRRSNIILVSEGSGLIVDSIKHLTADMNSYRQILPGIKYVYPPSRDKLEPLVISQNELLENLNNSDGNLNIGKFISTSLDGVSIFASREICRKALLDEGQLIGDLDYTSKNRLIESVFAFIDSVKNCSFKPCIYYDGDNMFDFYSFKLDYLEHMDVKAFPDISTTIEEFFSNKDRTDRIRQRSSDILKVINNNLNRCYKKLSIQEEKLNECSKKDTWKLYGDLIMAHLYEISKGQTKAAVTNYFDDNLAQIEIPLDIMLTPSENAQRYYKKYNKDKTAEASVTKQREENLEEIKYLEGQLVNLQNCTEDDEIDEIRAELVSLGYKKKGKNTASRKKVQSKPLSFISSEGFEIYVGKNNLQNDYLTLKFASPQDIWMHTKEIPGSHVIIKCGGKEPGQATLDEAANLSAYYSKAKESSNVPVDYTERKNVKKPSGAKPGMVIYYTNRTIYITPDESKVKKMEKKPAGLS